MIRTIIRRPLCFCSGLLLLLLFWGRMVCGVQWEPELHPGIPEEERRIQNRTVTVSGEVYQKKQQSEQQILYISYQKSKTIIYNPQIQKINIGDRIEVSGRPSYFQLPRNPGNFNQQFYYYKEGIRAAVFAEQVQVVEKSAGLAGDVIKEQLFRLKCSWEQIFLQSLGQEQGAIMTGILLGDKSQMDADLKDLYQKNGIGHILAISGLHISFIGLGMYRLLRKSGLCYTAAGGLSIFMLLLYGSMVGAGVSSVRAIIMLVVKIGADILGRVYDIKTALAIAAAGLVMWRPLYLFDAGFLLSFGAVVGIAYIQPMVTASKNRILQGISVSISVNLALFPILLYFYFEFPVYSFFLNIFVIPLMSLVLGCGLLGSGIYMISPLLGQYVLKVCGAILWLYESSCAAASRLPMSRVVFGKPEVWQIVLYYICLFLWMWCRRKPKRKHILLLMGMVLLFVPGHGKRGALDITVLDVGQGDGIFLRGPSGQTYVIDGGSSDVKEVGKYRMEPYLKSEGVGALDYVFVTHGDADHINGIEELLKRQSVGVRIHALVLPARQMQEEALLNLAETAKKNHTKVLQMGQGERLTETEGKYRMRFTCLHPHAEDTDEDSNSASMVLSLEMGSFRMLLTGDLEGQGEEAVYEALDGKPYDILKVAHHGSRNSGSVKFLERVQPKRALISAGQNNRYGHPHKETLQALRNAGCRIYETAKQGALQFRVSYEGE